MSSLSAGVSHCLELPPALLETRGFPSIDRAGVSDFGKWVVVKIRVPFLGTLNTRCRTILRTQKGTIILTTTQIDVADIRTRRC